MKNDPKRYVRLITGVTDVLEDTGSTVDPFFQELKQAIDTDKVNQMDSSRLEIIKNAFQEATQEYRDNSALVKKGLPPVQLIGKHRLFSNEYEKYVDACQVMVDSIDPENKQVDITKFNQSEADQEASMAKVSKLLERIMGTILSL